MLNFTRTYRASKICIYYVHDLLAITPYLYLVQMRRETQSNRATLHICGFTHFFLVCTVVHMFVGNVIMCTYAVLYSFFLFFFLFMLFLFLFFCVGGWG